MCLSSQSQTRPYISKKESDCIVLELRILLPQPPKCWDFRTSCIVYFETTSFLCKIPLPCVLKWAGLRGCKPCSPHIYTSDFDLGDCLPAALGTFLNLRFFPIIPPPSFLEFVIGAMLRFQDCSTIKVLFLPCISFCIANCPLSLPVLPLKCLLASTLVPSILKNSGLFVFFMLYGNNVFRILRDRSLQNPPLWR